ncbi:helix-turn-helix domain-containing protein [Agromyces binzhouensis]|uniref:DNA-binding protein n=1 Tax=Agromyces binzhouensis TaxID=1817495 RepID=A0A4Q2JU69_9MICO|nr:helix-turn-helix domain-containing protein [Agromyces binzhouensis]RXZ51885.1 DNA-binding protein [Agromyces binzhouensis]
MSDKVTLKRLLDNARRSLSGADEALERFVEDHRVGEVLDSTRAAEYCGLAKGTLYNLASRREGPVQHKHGRKTVYYPVDLDVYLFSRVQPILSDAA